MISSIGNNICFKSSIIVDVGASTKEGSCKIDVSSNDFGTQLVKDKSIVNNPGCDAFENEEDFLKKLGKKIAIAQSKASEQIDKLGLKKNEKTINKIFLFPPSDVFENKLVFCPNLKTTKGSLNNLDLGKIGQVLKDMGVKVSSSLKIHAFQDVIGSGLGMVVKLNDLGMLKPGKAYSMAITGGGCGVVNIKSLSGNKVLLDSSGSNFMSDDKGVIKLSRFGASVPFFIENFCKKFGFNKDQTEKAVSSGIAQLATSESFVIPRTLKGEKLEKLLLESGKYEKIVDKSGGVTLKLKKDFSKDFNNARFSAIEKYASALSRLAVVKQNEDSNGFIVSGPLAKGIDKSCKDNYKMSLSKLIQDKIDEKYTSEELKHVCKAYDFKVLCGEDFQVEDNTSCKSLLKSIKTLGNRGNWVEATIKKVKKY